MDRTTLDAFAGFLRINVSTSVPCSSGILIPHPFNSQPDLCRKERQRWVGGCLEWGRTSPCILQPHHPFIWSAPPCPPYLTNPLFLMCCTTEGNGCEFGSRGPMKGRKDNTFFFVSDYPNLPEYPSIHPLKADPRLSPPSIPFSGGGVGWGANGMN